MLKTLAGMYHARAAAAEGVVLADATPIASDLLVRTLTSMSWRPGCGMYIRGIQNEDIAAQDSIGFAPLTSQIDGRVVGCLMKLMGFEFMVVFDPAGADFGRIAQAYVFRPSNLVFEDETRARVLVLTWVPGTKPYKVTVKWKRKARKRDWSAS